MEPIYIRTAELVDLDSILSLSDELTMSDLPYDTQVKVDWAHSKEGETYYTDKITQNDGICFIAEFDSKIVGYATCALKEVPSYRTVTVAELENLVVAEDARNKGIGHMLTEKFIDWAKDLGAKKACVNVFSSNEKGVAFYTREGFRPYEFILEMPLSKK